MDVAGVCEKCFENEIAHLREASFKPVAADTDAALTVSAGAEVTGDAFNDEAFSFSA